MEKIRGRAGSTATDEFINLLHQENFNRSLFKQKIKTSEDSQVINHSRCN